ncbi:MAG: endonuclease [Saprospiraceae bacterium]|nr:MAG: endonuclease [Saprospiraceae bacterium]
MQRTNKLLRWTNIILIFATLGAYLSPYLHPTHFWVFSVLGLFYPWLLLGNVLFVLAWLILRKRYLFFSLCCILLGWDHFTGFVGIHKSDISKVDTDLVVMTYNCHGLLKMNSKTYLTPKELQSLVDKYQPDLLCLQEFPFMQSKAPPYVEQLQKNTKLKYFHRVAGGGIAVFSRYPFGKKDGKYFTNKANGYMHIDIETGEHTLRLFNIHLQTNAVSSMANRVANEGNFQEKETWFKIKGMIGRYRRSAGMRANQAKEIAANIARSPYPVLVCGDFNDVPQSYSYHQLAIGLKDSFKSAGRGLGTTFNGKIPALRIDYILADPRLHIKTHHNDKSPFSDHFPVISRMSF